MAPRPKRFLYAGARCPGGESCSLRQNINYVNQLLSNRSHPYLLIEHPKIPGKYALVKAEMPTFSFRHSLFMRRPDPDRINEMTWLSKMISKHEKCIERSVSSPFPKWPYLLDTSWTERASSEAELVRVYDVREQDKFLHCLLDRLDLQDIASKESITRLNVSCENYYDPVSLDDAVINSWLQCLSELTPNLAEVTLIVPYETLYHHNLVGCGGGGYGGGDGYYLTHYLECKLRRLVVTRFEDLTGNCAVEAEYRLREATPTSPAVLMVARRAGVSLPFCFQEDVFAACTSLETATFNDYVDNTLPRRRIPVENDEEEIRMAEQQSELDDSDAVDRGHDVDVPPSFMDDYDGSSDDSEVSHSCHMNWLWLQLFAFLESGARTCVIKELSCRFCITCHRNAVVEKYMNALARNVSVRVLGHPTVYTNRDTKAFLQLLRNNRVIDTVRNLLLGRSVYYTPLRIKALAQVVRECVFNVTCLTFSDRVTFFQYCEPYFFEIIHRVAQNARILNRLDDLIHYDNRLQEEYVVSASTRLSHARTSNVLRAVSCMNRCRVIERVGKVVGQHIYTRIHNSLLRMSSIVRTDAEERVLRTLLPREMWAKICSCLHLQDVSCNTARIARECV